MAYNLIPTHPSIAMGTNTNDIGLYCDFSEHVPDAGAMPVNGFTVNQKLMGGVCRFVHVTGASGVIVFVNKWGYICSMTVFQGGQYQIPVQRFLASGTTWDGKVEIMTATGIEILGGRF